MDNKTKYLYVAIAILLASNGYLLYRLGNAEGKAESADDTKSSNSKKISGEFKSLGKIPIGTYIAEGDGVNFRGFVFNKIYLRDDGKVELNDSVGGGWKNSINGTGYYRITMDIYRTVNIKVDGIYLFVTSVYGEHNGANISLTEKDFIRFKKVE